MDEDYSKALRTLQRAGKPSAFLDHLEINQLKEIIIDSQLKIIEKQGVEWKILDRESNPGYPEVADYSYSYLSKKKYLKTKAGETPKYISSIPHVVFTMTCYKSGNQFHLSRGSQIYDYSSDNIKKFIIENLPIVNAPFFQNLQSVIEEWNKEGSNISKSKGYILELVTIVIQDSATGVDPDDYDYSEDSSLPILEFRTALYACREEQEADRQKRQEKAEKQRQAKERAKKREEEREKKVLAELLKKYPEMKKG